jgi:peptidoglycan-associated lipoprotein
MTLWGTLALAATGCGPEYPNCSQDEDCHEAEYCVNGHCQQCRTADDCPRGQSCSAGRCDPISGYCESGEDCAEGERCEDHRCAWIPTPTLAATTPDTPPPACQLRTVSFAFDSEDLSADSRDQIEQNAVCIRERGIGSMHLAGHCDPRGTEEYNLALGDRRARSVQRYLRSLGIEAQVSVSSMGEEMARGVDEGSWRQDRRVVFLER